MPNDPVDPPFRLEHFRQPAPEDAVEVERAQPAGPDPGVAFWDTPPRVGKLLPEVKLPLQGGFRLEVEGLGTIDPASLGQTIVIESTPPPPFVIMVGPVAWSTPDPEQAEARVFARASARRARYTIEEVAGDSVLLPASGDGTADPDDPPDMSFDVPPWAKLISLGHALGLRSCAAYEHRRVGAPTRRFARRCRRVEDRARSQALPELAKLARTLRFGASRFGLRGATDAWLRSVRAVLPTWPGKLAEWRARGDEARFIAACARAQKRIPAVRSFVDLMKTPAERYHKIVVGRQLTPDEHRRARFLLAQLDRAVDDLASTR